MLYSVASCVVLASALTSASHLNKRADCQAQANACRTAPEANQSFCSAQLAACLGYNPYANNTATTTSSSYVPKESCQAVADQCRVKPGANQATCSAELAACLGYNPYEPRPIWTAETVTKFTTYCSYPTTLVYNNKTYTATKDQTLTITDCPCTITKPVNPPYTNPAQPQPTESATTKQEPPVGTPQPQPGTTVAGPPDSPAATYTGPVVDNPTTTGTQVEFTGAASFKKPAAVLLAIGVGAFALL
ncbi:hypothetical protein BKA64DRAFT_663990 [Cadophora sp. MPI-SDFR-AT-0126]|nr:hypothetical protein BKA64DRAFT_663990 [Leotiomycetes sp. MPI-SDFR-AT-0126]